MVVIDLEDAVEAPRKAEARELVLAWAGRQPPDALERIALRVNDAATRFVAEDLELVRASGLRQVMLPKVEHAEQVELVLRAVPEARVLPLVESARGLEACRDIAAAPGVLRLVFGTLDFAVDLDLDIDEDPWPLEQAAAQLVLASRLAGLAPPVAGVTPQLQDEARLLSDWSWFRRRGFGAKLCIHPGQIEPVHAAIAPDAAALDWARRVVAADAAGAGAVSVDGRMVDRPVVLQALRVLRRAGL
jgi:citrate lyase subunit beta/citryl-CoA lyase